MQCIWQGNILGQTSRSLNLRPALDDVETDPSTAAVAFKDVRLHHLDGLQTRILDGPLELLTHIDCAKIPLSIIIQSRLQVQTASHETQDSFSEILLPDGDESTDTLTPSWQDTDAIQSPIGILVRVPSGSCIPDHPQGRLMITELVLIAERSMHGIDSTEAAMIESEIKLIAIPLSSLLLYRPTPLVNLDQDPRSNAMFLPSQYELEQMENESRRKADIDTIFDNHAAQQKEDRRRRKQLLMAKQEDTQQSLSSLPMLNKHERSTSRVSTEFNVDVLRADSCGNSVETRNKSAVARSVMTGMRLIGYQPKHKSRGEKADEKHDEEYKAVYHQTYKATCFALRSQMKQGVLDPQTLQETVDRLLDIFCDRTDSRDL